MYASRIRQRLVGEFASGQTVVDASAVRVAAGAAESLPTVSWPDFHPDILRGPLICTLATILGGSSVHRTHEYQILS